MRAEPHIPYVITQAFPLPQEEPVTGAVPDRLWLPVQPSRPCPLVVRITAGEDAAQEARRLTNEGFAVYTWYAEQKNAEQDPAACAVLQAELEQRLDTLLQKHPVLDARRVFVDGWLAAYLIFHTQRFRAAIQRPALINPTTAYGNCAAGWRKPFGNSLEEMLLSLAEHSVLTDVDACKTPCLILCREDEMRYSREQSEQLYAAIKDRDPDVTCRMAVFTARQWERHGMQEVADWWKRFVREAEHEK